MPNYSIVGAINSRDILGVVGEYDDWHTSLFYSDYKPSPAQARSELIADFLNFNSDDKVLGVKVYGIKNEMGEWV